MMHCIVYTTAMDAAYFKTATSQVHQIYWLAQTIQHAQFSSILKSLFINPLPKESQGISNHLLGLYIT